MKEIISDVKMWVVDRGPEEMPFYCDIIVALLSGTVTFAIAKIIEPALVKLPDMLALIAVIGVIGVPALKISVSIIERITSKKFIPKNYCE